MSRIHEALAKARQQQLGNAPGLPNIEEIIATGVSSPGPETAGWVDRDALPPEMLEPIADKSAILTNCHQREWPIKSENMILLADSTEADGGEQLRTLRSRLYQMRGDAGALKVIVVSSAVAAEGKSFLCANLAHAFALQSDWRALVIDADLRKSSGLTTFLEAPYQPGLSDYLMGEQSAENIIHTGSLKNLYLIPRGRRVPNPGELIGDSKFRSLIQLLRPVFDWIIIDTPPIIPISDAGLIAHLSDGVILVVNANSTPVNLTKRATQEFHRNRILGIVLNRSSAPNAKYYSAYGYDNREVESK